MFFLHFLIMLRHWFDESATSWRDGPDVRKFTPVFLRPGTSWRPNSNPNTPPNPNVRMSMASEFLGEKSWSGRSRQDVVLRVWWPRFRCCLQFFFNAWEILELWQRSFCMLCRSRKSIVWLPFYLWRVLKKNGIDGQLLHVIKAFYGVD